MLAGLPAGEAKHKEELFKTIQKCRPLLTLRKSGDEARIGFVNADVKKHLHKNSNKLLDLPEDAIQLQHGILALRCFSHIMDNLTAALQSTIVAKSPTSSQSQQTQHQPVAMQGPVTAAGPGVSGAPDIGDDTEDEEIEFDFDDDESTDLDSTAQAPDTPQQAPILPYATRYWLQHASEATRDIAERLSLEKAFWEPDSEIRHLWLTEFERLTGAFDGLVVDKRLKALHVAASVGFPRLVASLLKAGYDKEVNEYDTYDNAPVGFFFEPSTCSSSWKKTTNIAHSSTWLPSSARQISSSSCLRSRVSNSMTPAKTVQRVPLFRWPPRAARFS